MRRRRTKYWRPPVVCYSNTNPPQAWNRISDFVETIGWFIPTIITPVPNVTMPLLFRQIWELWRGGSNPLLLMKGLVGPAGELLGIPDQIDGFSLHSDPTGSYVSISYGISIRKDGLPESWVPNAMNM